MQEWVRKNAKKRLDGRLVVRATVWFDADVYDCEVVEGAIPSDLAGTFYRVGGEWLYPPLYRDDSPFNADGYVSSFRIANGSVDFKGRWIQTDRWKAQQKQRRQLFGYYRNGRTDDPAAAPK